jgi:hypothetical protein
MGFEKETTTMTSVPVEKKQRSAAVFDGAR